MGSRHVERPDQRHRDHQRRVVEFVEPYQTDIAACAHRLGGHQPPNVGIAAAAGAQHRRATAQVLEIRQPYFSRQPNAPPILNPQRESLAPPALNIQSNRVCSSPYMLRMEIREAQNLVDGPLTD